ncbi:MAG: TetR/AcrR family transcriptional regulator [Chlorobi bacterium]|nr:TetR/AcrR family transcriptional regulator [Chlorobiota bacterium]
MTPKTTAQLKGIKEAREQQILDTACRLFANHGFHETSISQIAREAGISKGLIYNYFDSKESILRDLMKRGMDEMYKDFDPNHDGILTHDEFLFFISSYLDTLKENREFWKLYFAILIQPSVINLVQEEMMSMGIPVFSILHKYFEDNHYEDPDTEFEFLAAILSGLAIKYINAPEFFHLDKLKEKIYKLYNPSQK